MNFPTPHIVDATLASATAAGCDCVMLKHVGWPVSINVSKGVGNIYSDFEYHLTGKREVIATVTPIEPIDALMIGAKNLGPTLEHVYLHDTWWMDGQDIQHLTYRERFVLTRCNAKRFDDRFEPIWAMPISAAPALWRKVMESPEKFNGLIFRRSKDTAAGKLYVCRYYAAQPRGINDPSLLDLELRKLTIQAHQYLYYIEGKPTLADKEYDDLCASWNIFGGGGSDLESSYSTHVKCIAWQLQRDAEERLHDKS